MIEQKLHNDDLERLACSGIVTSFAYGPCGDSGNRWSVMCHHIDGMEFEKPFAAKSLFHAMEIATLECGERGWLA